MTIKTYGFIESPIENDHYLMGDLSLQPQVLQPDGQWDTFLPADQIQNKNGLETENCTSYGTLHALGTLGNRKFGTAFQKNLSERYLGIVAETGVNGNDPHHVAECIRLGYGVVPDAFLSFTDTIDTWVKYYSPKPISYYYFALGQHWLKKYKFSHQWIILPGDSLQLKQQKMMEALKYSPLGASVWAWSQHADGKYYSDQPYFVHWITVYGYVQGQYWKVFDSYDNTHKQLDWNFTFGQAKGYALDYNVGGEQLGDAPEQVYLSYGIYLAQQYLKSIIK